MSEAWVVAIFSILGSLLTSIVLWVGNQVVEYLKAMTESISNVEHGLTDVLRRMGSHEHRIKQLETCQKKHSMVEEIRGNH
ncbi:MAG: hypothetical protein NVSMB70_05410 [Chamaesiphon sp.]